MGRSYKNVCLINSLDVARDSMCRGIGMKRVKLFLNRKVRDGDEHAALFRRLLEIETVNIRAKKYRDTMSFGYRNMYYGQKHKMINDLIVSLSNNNPLMVNVWCERSDVSDTGYIIYFEHPSFGQVSFHADIDDVGLVMGVKGVWDGMVNSTISKLESAMLDRYWNELQDAYGDVIERYVRENEERLKAEQERLEKAKMEREAFDRKACAVYALLVDRPSSILTVEETDMRVHKEIINRLPKNVLAQVVEVILGRFVQKPTYEEAKGVLSPVLFYYAKRGNLERESHRKVMERKKLLKDICSNIIKGGVSPTSEEVRFLAGNRHLLSNNNFREVVMHLLVELSRGDVTLELLSSYGKKKFNRFRRQVAECLDKDTQADYIRLIMPS